MGNLAILAGTGPLGTGLALRFAAAGEHVVIGSRVSARAEAVAAKVREALPDAVADGFENMEALARAERVVLALPVAGLSAFLVSAGPRLAGKLVIDVMVPIAFREGFCELVPVPGAPSVGELVQRTVPAARVVSAFKNLPADRLRDLSRRLEGDVVLCGEDAAARAEVAALVAKLPGLRPVDAGGIANARYLEAITALLLNLNRRHGALTSIAVVGL